jgi:4,5-dihydroxyphthalate decarboxylase
MGSKTIVRFAGRSYLDRTAALESREVIPAGAELRLIRTTSEEAARELLQAGEADLAEVPLSSLFEARFCDEYSALPVFPNRAFVSRFLVGPGTLDAGRLEGACLGIAEEARTLGAWVRDVVDAATGKNLEWTTAPAAELVARLRDGTLTAALLPGDVDGLGPAVSDPDGLDRAAYAATRTFPILSVVAGRRELFDANRWLPVALTDAFVEAKDLGSKRHRYFGALSVGLPWLMGSIRDIDENFAGDAWRYGLGPSLDALRRFADRLGADSSDEAITSKFAPETVPLPGIPETSFYVVPLSHI